MKWQCQASQLAKTMCSWRESARPDATTTTTVPCVRSRAKKKRGVLCRNEESAKKFWSDARPMRSGTLYNFPAMLAWWYIKRRFSAHSFCLNAAPVILCQTTEKLASIVLPPKRSSRLRSSARQIPIGRWYYSTAGQLPIAQPSWSFFVIVFLFP